MMNERSKFRPKSSISALGKSGNLYSSMRGPDCWRGESNGDAVWASDSSLLGIKGSKYTPHPWHVNIGPQSGGFLPVLKARSRPSTGLRKITKQNKIKASIRSSDTVNAGGKIFSTNTASLLDLNTVVPSSGKRGVVKLYRENSLPANFQVIPPPVLRYSHESNVEAVLSKLDLLDGVTDTQDGDTKDDDLSLNQTALQSLTEDIKQTSLMPEPPPTSREQSMTRFSNISSIVKSDTIADLSNEMADSKWRPNEMADSKWRLNVLIPNSTGRDDEQMTSDDNNNSSDEIDTIKDFNNPRSILKQNDLEHISEPPIKKQTRISSYLLSTPLPPSARPAKAAVVTNKKRVIRNKQGGASQFSNPQSDSSLETASESDRLSIDQEMDSTNTETGSNKPVDEPKSVRFSEQPVKVKEYYPWEPPQHSIVYMEPKPPPKVTVKSSPVFRP